MSLPPHLLMLATLRLLTLEPSNERFSHVKATPLRILSDLTAAYLELLGAAAKGYAEQGGRTAVNALDARDALKCNFGVELDEIREWCDARHLASGILSGNHPEAAHSRDAAIPGPSAEEAALEAINDQLALGSLLKDTASSSCVQEPRQIIEYAPITVREARVIDAVQQGGSLLPFLPPALQEQVIKEEEDRRTVAKSRRKQSRSASLTQLEASPSPSTSSLRLQSISPPPPTYNEAVAEGAILAKPVLRIKDRSDPNGKGKASASSDNEEEDEDPLSFLPPFPDVNAGQAALQTVIEDESGRTIKRARRALDISIKPGSAAAAWQRAIPYEHSSLAEFDGDVEQSKQKLPSIPIGEGGLSSSLDAGANGDDEEDSMNPFSNVNASSLFYFLETFNWIALDQEQQIEAGQVPLPLRQNAKRKRAATAIHSNILNPADDSLSGSIPIFPPRHAKKQAGWIPYPPTNNDIQDNTEPAGKAILPFPALHPFSTQLPITLTEPVPNISLPHPARSLAPPMHPRYPTSHSSIRTLLESSSPALFNRTTRLGPPGPLLDNGAAGYYQVEAEKPSIPGWPGDAMPRMMGWNFDWEIGNELEDAIKERKDAGMPNSAAVPSSSAITIAARATSAQPTSSKEAHFPAMPGRPSTNPHIQAAEAAAAAAADVTMELHIEDDQIQHANAVKREQSVVDLSQHIPPAVKQQSPQQVPTLQADHQMSLPAPQQNGQADAVINASQLTALPHDSPSTSIGFRQPEQHAPAQQQDSNGQDIQNTAIQRSTESPKMADPVIRSSSEVTTGPTRLKLHIRPSFSAHPETTPVAPAPTGEQAKSPAAVVASQTRESGPPLPPQTDEIAPAPVAAWAQTLDPDQNMVSTSSPQTVQFALAPLAPAPLLDADQNMAGEPLDVIDKPSMQDGVEGDRIQPEQPEPGAILENGEPNPMAVAEIDGQADAEGSADASEDEDALFDEVAVPSEQDKIQPNNPEEGEQGATLVDAISESVEQAQHDEALAQNLGHERPVKDESERMASPPSFEPAASVLQPANDIEFEEMEM